MECENIYVMAYCVHTMRWYVCVREREAERDEIDCEGGGGQGVRIHM